jgi:hypothetical protein
MGEPPTHPELLDWLAVELIRRGWRLKDIHRLILTSEAYRMASAFDDREDSERDPENRYLWRYLPQRLDAEIVRDSILSVSGGIDLTVGGPPIFPNIPEEILKSQAHGVWRNQPDGPEVWRRSVYVYRRRSLNYPFFTTFDSPDPNITAAARSVSTVATQALTLLNNPFVLRQAELFADRLRNEAEGSVPSQIDRAYRIALNRPPTDEESRIARNLVEQGSLASLTHVMLNLNEFLYQR